MATDYMYIRGNSFTMHALEIGENKTLCNKPTSRFPHIVWQGQRDQFRLCNNCKKELDTQLP
jgi:hypothetical protein